MDTRFTDRIETAIREERRREALWTPAVNKEDAATASAAEDDVSPAPSAGVGAAHQPADQPAADDAVTTQAG